MGWWDLLRWLAGWAARLAGGAGVWMLLAVGLLYILFQILALGGTVFGDPPGGGGDGGVPPGGEPPGGGIPPGGGPVPPGITGGGVL